LTIWIGFTNQKLYQARLLLEQAEQSQTAALSDALGDAALMHMQFAFRAYLNEMAAATNLKTEVATLAELLAKTPLVTGEMREWQILAADAFSWFSAFNRAVDLLGWPQQPVIQAHPKDNAVNLIAVAVDESGSDVSGWWQALSTCIDAQRQNRQET
jgi:hypothetical protein